MILSIKRKKNMAYYDDYEEKENCLYEQYLIPHMICIGAEFTIVKKENAIYMIVYGPFEEVKYDILIPFEELRLLIKELKEIDCAQFNILDILNYFKIEL